MCGRFTQHYTWAEVHAFLSVFGTPRNLQPRYNIARTTMIDGGNPQHARRRTARRGSREIVPGPPREDQPAQRRIRSGNRGLK
jgi:putative SOS response-associated peptidase YedK